MNQSLPTDLDVEITVGPPGTGKTTYMSHLVRSAVEDDGHVPMVASLTKAAAIEIAGRDLGVADNMVGTLHSMAYRAIGGNVKILEADATMLKTWNGNHSDWQLAPSKGILDSPYSTNNKSNALTEAFQYRTTRKPMREEAALALDAWDAYKKELGDDVLDFTDLLEIALSTDSPGYECTAMYIDEAQDLSPLERELIFKWASSGNVRKLVFTGDGDQSIFRFRGADSSLFDFDPDRNINVLQQSYRVPRNVHALARRWIRGASRRNSDYEWFPRDFDGSVMEGHVFAEHLVRSLPKDEEVMILAAASYMLLPVLDALRRNGIAYHNPFRTSEAAWNPLGGTSANSLHRRLAAFLSPYEDGWSAEQIQRWNGIFPAAKVFLKRGMRKKISEGYKHTYSTNAEMNEDILREDLVHVMQALRRKSYQVPIQFLRDNTIAKHDKRIDTFLGFVENAGIESLNEKPKVTVGTIHCSPPDEPVLTTEGYVPIGDLDPDKHRLASHNRNINGMTWGGTNNRNTDGFTFKKSSRKFDGNLIVIETDKSKTKVTPEHRILTKFSNEIWSKYCVYLMNKGDWWRIGMCKTGERPYKSGGVPGRLATEKADAAWILSVHDTRKEARKSESTWQTIYGIPGFTFYPSSSNRDLNETDMSEFYNSTSSLINKRITKLFKDLTIQIDQPLYIRPRDNNKQDWFTTAAGNLIPLDGYIKFAIPRKEFLDRYTERKMKFRNPEEYLGKINIEPYKGKVYGLDVPPYHYYVSGGAVVHNSVKGAESPNVILLDGISGAAREEAIGDPLYDLDIRRLFYVGMTRSSSTLQLCRASSETRGRFPILFP